MGWFRTWPTVTGYAAVGGGGGGDEDATGAGSYGDCCCWLDST